MPCTGEGEYQMSSEEQHSYDRRLLKPGHAGELTPDEFRYVKSELQRSSSLRRKWRSRPSAKRLSEKHIRAVARDGLLKKQRSVLASAAVKKKQFR